MGGAIGSDGGNYDGSLMRRSHRYGFVKTFTNHPEALTLEICKGGQGIEGAICSEALFDNDASGNGGHPSQYRFLFRIDAVEVNMLWLESGYSLNKHVTDPGRNVVVPELSGKIVPHFEIMPGVKADTRQCLLVHLLVNS